LFQELETAFAILVLSQAFSLGELELGLEAPEEFKIKRLRAIYCISRQEEN